MIQKKIVCAKHSVTQLHKIVLEYNQSVEFHEKALNVRVFHVKQIKFTCTSREERVTGTSLTRASFNDRRSFEFHETQTYVLSHNKWVYIHVKQIWASCFLLRRTFIKVSSYLYVKFWIKTCKSVNLCLKVTSLRFFTAFIPL